MPDNTVKFGYKLSSEEFPASELVRLAGVAEQLGFAFALIWDHFHPWTGREGQSPFGWSVLGGIAQVTNTLVMGTGVTCPTTRIHPAIIAQASASVASMMPGRFFLGVGSGENLNEHIVGAGWPEVAVRQEKLEEAIHIIRLLWQGGVHSFHGKHFTVENARLYSMPKQSPPLMVAASGPNSARLAARAGDGLISTLPERKILEEFGKYGGAGKPTYAEVTVCYDRSEADARRLAHEVWPIAGLPGVLQQELPLPSHFERAAKLATEEQVAGEVPCGPDPQKHIRLIRKYIEAGYDHICIHQIGPKQEPFMDFYMREILPEVEAAVPAVR